MLGTDPRQQMRSAQSLLALALSLLFAALQQVEVLLGVVDQQASLALTACMLGGGLLFVASSAAVPTCAAAPTRR